MKRTDSILQNYYMSKLPKAQQAGSILPGYGQQYLSNRTGDMQSVYPQTTSKAVEKKLDAVKKAKAFEQIQRQGTISTPSKKQTTTERAWEIASNPAQAFGYAVRNERLPEWFSKNKDRSSGLNDIVNTLNPFQMVNFAGQAASGTKGTLSALSKGDFDEAGDQFEKAVFGALAASPLIKGVPILGKGLSTGARQTFNQIDRSFLPVGKALRRIETEGKAAGLSDWDIARRQLDQVGITSNQRQGYVPGISELSRKYITPYGYNGIEGANKFEEIIRNIGRGGFDYNSPNIHSIVDPARADAWNMYLGFPQRNRTFRLADTAPVNHRAFPRKKLEGMDIYNLNEEKLITEDITSRIPTPSEVKDVINNLTSESFVKVDPIGVMGNYNARFTNEGLQYNDIWDLDPSISSTSFLPDKIATKLEGNPLFYKNEGVVSTPRSFTVPVSKFFGKPFLSHGTLPLTAKQYRQGLVDKLIHSYNRYQSLNETYPGMYDPKLSKIQEQIEQLKNINKDKLKQTGGIIDDNRGQWAYPGKVTRIQGNKMATHGYGNIPLHVKANTGEERIVYPNTGIQTFDGAESFVETPLSDYYKMKMGGSLTPNKARQILHDKEIHGKPLTEKQRKFFGAMSKGHTKNYQVGGLSLTSLPSNWGDRLSDVLSFPQRAITKLFTGKYQTPSEAMKIENPWGAMATDMLLDPLNLMGAGAVKTSGVYKNAYKLNPWRFKPNPEAYYRMIGQEGYADALESGLLRSNPGKGGLQTQQFDDVYFSMKHPWDGRNYGYVTKSGEPIGGVGYKGPYMAELTGQELNHPISSFPRANMAQSKVPISLENPGLKLYKQDWLRGYKQVKPPKKQDGGSFGSAFAAARRAGKDVFTWNGKSYTTETKEEQDNKTKQKDMIPPSKRPTPTPFVKRAIAPQTKEVVVDKRNMFERFFNMSEDEVKRFNLPLDVYDAYEKQKEGNKGKNFGIVSKKNARAYFFDPEGRLAVEDEVGIGKDRGDEQPIYYQVMTTPSGTYNMYRAKVAPQVADRMKKGYDADNFFYMDNQDVNKRLIHPEKGKTAKQAMHGIPKHLLSERSKAFGNETLDDNYMSAGCINCKRPFLDNPYFNSFNQGQVYVLPEKKSGGMPCYECGGQYQNGGHYNLEGEWVKSKGSGTFSGNAYYKDGGNSTDEYINNTLNSNQMNPLYHFIKRAQMGGEQQSQDGQVMQLIQAYAQMQGVDPQQIMAQLQQMTGPEQQQAVQQMMEAVQSQDQETINFTNPMMAYGGEMGGPVILPSLPVDVYGMPMYGGGGAAAYLNPYTDAMMEMQDGGKPEWLIRAQLKAQGYTGSALENKLSQMKQGGIHINPANKGKFTAKAKAAGMGVQAFASKVLGAPEGKYSPATRKQANFAKNASKWKKQLGGLAEGSVLNNVDQDTIDELTRLGYQFEIM